MADNKIDNASPTPNGGELFENLASEGASIFSIKPMAKYLSGARCVLRLNGKIVGFAFGIAWNISTDVTEIRTIDDYMPYELAPKHISVSGSISGFRIPGSGPTQTLLQADALSFLHQRYIEIEVRDSQTDNLIFVTKRALITNRTENSRSGELTQMSLNFKAIGWADERSPDYLDNSSTEDVKANSSNTDTSTNPLGSLNLSNFT